MKKLTKVFSFLFKRKCLLENKAGSRKSPDCVLSLHSSTRFSLPHELQIGSAPLLYGQVFLCLSFCLFNKADDTCRLTDSRGAMLVIRSGKPLVLHLLTHAVCSYKIWDNTCWFVPSGCWQKVSTHFLCLFSTLFDEKKQFKFWTLYKIALATIIPFDLYKSNLPPFILIFSAVILGGKPKHLKTAVTEWRYLLLPDSIYFAELTCWQ